MAGFEPRSSDVGSDRSANCATTTPPLTNMFRKSWAVVVALFAERSLPIPEVRGSNPVIGKLKVTKEL